MFLLPSSFFSPFFVVFFLLRFCSLLFVALLCSVHSTQLCKTRRRRRHRRRHRTFSRFNCKCFRIVLRSLEARGTASPLHHPRVPRNYDIVLNRVCACCRRWFYFFFFFHYSAVVGCGNVLFARENDFLRFSVIFILSFGFGSSHKSNARIYGSERSTTHTLTHIAYCTCTITRTLPLLLFDVSFLHRFFCLVVVQSQSQSQSMFSNFIVVLRIELRSPS